MADERRTAPPAKANPPRRSASAAARLAALPSAHDMVFPAYGSMHKAMRDSIRNYPVPVGYAALPGTEVQAAWDARYGLLLKRVADTFWPRWAMQPLPAHWDGAATARMQALTDADFKLLPALKALIDGPVSQRAAGLGVGALATTAPHADFFKREDGGGELWPVMDYLVADDKGRLAAAATKAALAPFAARVNVLKFAHPTALILPMKDAIQRPRPYQIASLRGEAFEYLYGPGAVTSALPSGHANQGVMAVCGALMEVWAALSPTPEMLSRLRQYAIDVGDRRVMAGVHYPSDNLSSWCLALSLCDELYGPNAKAGRHFLAEAVQKHSVVYRALVDSKDAAFAPGLEWFDELVAA